MSALIADNIHKAFGDHEVLKGVSLSVARGEVVTLIGASGSGKIHLPALPEPPGNAAAG